MFKYHVVDESKAGRSESFDRRYSVLLGVFKTLEAALGYVTANISSTRRIMIEEWENDNFFVDAYTLTNARKVVKRSTKER